MGKVFAEELFHECLNKIDMKQCSQLFFYFLWALPPVYFFAMNVTPNQFKAGINSLGRRERGFDIDRTHAIPRVELRHELRIADKPIYKTSDTRLYGEVIIRYGT